MNLWNLQYKNGYMKFNNILNHLKLEKKVDRII